ncbi:Rgg family transcriptional regulator [Vagococcus elongatus]|uniref:HTH cro/C1-type domain-containing protein n=1 Tax=Vagococcus elongatus TaxID=180344 RepID=A0A430B3X7_9ENTE|nr:Rgg/GadR/MutR family transcriptional regulator [Vagococcus elongatus]RSU15047.1 hypothetical protein CBF29_01530 [Vagococcus elongatus]
MKIFYGPTIRDIRLNKGYSHKEIYTGILSKSYAIPFEKGEHDLTVSKLEKILERLELSYEELVYIHNGYEHVERTQNFKKIAEAANSGNIPKLEEIYLQLSPKNSDSGKFQAAFARICLEREKNEQTGSEKTTFDKKTVEYISNYLRKKDSMFLIEINVFINNIDIFPYELMLILLKQSFKSLKKYRDFYKFPNIVSSLLVNSLSVILHQRDWKNFAYYLSQLELYSLDHSQTFERIVYRFYLGISLMIDGKKEEGEQISLFAIQMLETLEQDKTAKGLLGLLQWFIGDYFKDSKHTKSF